jgi:hypothetical protein
MTQRKFISSLLATTLVAVALFGAGCKKEEKATEIAPAPASAPAQQAAQTAGPVGQEFTFEGGTDGWTPVAKSVTIEQVSDKKHNGNSSLKVSGSSPTPHFNFAFSRKFLLEPGKKYKLSGWTLVDSLNDLKHPPLLKCAVYQNGKWSSNYFTKNYYFKKKGEWQELSINFETPSSGKVEGLVSLEKGANDVAVDAVAYLDDIKLEIVQ